MHKSKPVMWRAMGALGAFLAGGLVAEVRAAPLENEACDQLKAEQATLGIAGARTHLAKGPAWAKANLSADKLQQIARLIEVDEQVSFRCVQPRQPLLRAATQTPAGADGTAPAAVSPKSKARAAAVKPPAAEGAAPDAAAPAAATPAPPAEASGKPPAPPRAATVRPKPKAADVPKGNDAYVPPATGDAAGGGLGGQVQRLNRGEPAKAPGQ